MIFCHRDQYVRINWENIRPGKEVNFERRNPSDVLLYGDYDYGSVMHYSRCGFHSNGWETITPIVSVCKVTLLGFLRLLTQQYPIFRILLPLLARELVWVRWMSPNWWVTMSVDYVDQISDVDHGEIENMLKTIQKVVLPFEAACGPS